MRNVPDTGHRRSFSVPEYVIFTCLGFIAFGSPLCFVGVDAVYFYVHESKEKCFVEDVTLHVPVSIAYKNPENPGIACSITIKNEEGRQVFSHQVTAQDPKGKMTYLTQSDGEHKVCIICPSSRWFSSVQLKWYLSIELGDTDINMDDVAKKSQVFTIEGRIKQLTQRVEAIGANNTYQRKQEEDFRTTSESINSRVMWFAVMQILVLCVVTMLAIADLTRFFQNQKLL